MGNVLKVKIGLITFSLLLLVLIPLLESNFNAPVTYKEWQQLSWADFQGIPRPFTRFDAGISSHIRVEWDSVTAKFVAYAVQNNQRSWKGRGVQDDDYLLNHEQYHFNITEIHARIMNNFLDSIQQLGITNYRDRLIKLSFELNRMQDEYDHDSDHSLVVGMQRRWEYRIDSLLNVHGGVSGKITDYYSGAQFYFPTKPAFVINRNEGKYVNRKFYIYNYGMLLAGTSSRFPYYEVPSLNNQVVQHYSDQAIEIISVENIASDFPFMKVVTAKDSIGNKMKEMWIYADEHLYILSSVYPDQTNGGETGYLGITNSFFNNFQKVDIDEYWFSIKDSISFENDFNKLYSGICTTETSPELLGFTTGPFIKENDGLLLVADYGELTGSIVQYATRIGNTMKIFNHKHQIYFIPLSELPEKPFLLEYGFLQKDSSGSCYQFRYQTYWIDMASKIW